MKSNSFRFLIYSFLLLFFELALIRFLSAHLRAFAFFLNVAILSTFLGMALGLLLEQRKKSFPFTFPALFFVLLLIVKYFSAQEIVTIPTNEFLWGLDVTKQISLSAFHIEFVVVVIFFFAAILFIPLGVELGRLFRVFPPLTAYSINIAGSLSGIIVFALLSFFSLPPFLWFVLGFGLFLCVYQGKKRLWNLCFVLGSLMVVHSMADQSGEIWSPYYKIQVQEVSGAPYIKLNVNGFLHQYMIDFSPEKIVGYPLLEKQKHDYLLPYAGLQNLDDVLILGSGTGNDVVLALQQGAKHIDAVEIDEKIWELGKKKHFNQPYDDPRVRVFIDDGRAFLKKNQKKYDLIVMGTLDSLTLLSGLSSVRLDNYMYTMESFRDLRGHLKEGGKLVTYHMSPAPYIARKIILLMWGAFGTEPQVTFIEKHILFNHIFVATNGRQAPLDGADEFSWWQGVPHDDWPYLYFKMPTVPRHYVLPLAVILVLSFAMIYRACRPLKRGDFDFPLFFMGAGFMLLETKGVAQMSLLFGSTWVVNVLVFSSILLVILLANVTVAKFTRLHDDGLFLLLFLSILVLYVFPLEVLLGLPKVLQWIAEITLVGLPFYFAGILFARIFKASQVPTASLAFNSFGAILGGCLEYSSMFWGMRELHLLALLFYLLAFWSLRRSISKPA